MIVLYTDFGIADPYVGQLHAAIAREAPGVPVIDLLHEVPNFDIRAGAYLLPSLAASFATSAIFVCVVDPGVGGDRRPILLRADRHWYIGPDNGLLEIVARRATSVEARVIDWRPQSLSASFHGRDLFAPVAARLARGHWPGSSAAALTPPSESWPDDLPAAIYVDHYGNVVSGYRAAKVRKEAEIVVAGHRLRHATTFSAVPSGTGFWYQNSMGLVEIAVNKGSAASALGITLGATLDIPQ